MRKYLTFTATLIVSMLLAFGGAQSAVAASASQDATISIDQEAEIFDNLVSFGVDRDVAQELVTSLKSGEPWDSWSNATPVSEDTRLIDGVEYTVSRYEDGSFLATAIEPSSTGEGVSAFGVQDCDTRGTSAGVGYGTNCTVIATDGAVSGQFEASFSFWATGHSIYNVRYGTVNFDIGTATSQGFSSSTAPGSSEWTQFNWSTNTSSWGTLSRYVRLTVSTHGASVTAGF